MTDETPDVTARARAALDAWESYVAAPDSTLMMPPPEHVLIAVIRDLLAEVERLRDDLRVERITTHLCESVDADLREARAEVERLQTKCETPGDAASDLAADGEATL